MMHSASRKRERKPQAPKQLNLTACIDVVFLLLIFFIVTTQFTHSEGALPASLPGGEDPAPRRPELPLKVHVTSLGQTGYRLDVDGHPTRPASFGDLIAMLSQLQDKPAAGRHGLYADDNLVLIAPDKQVRWQHVLNAYNASRQAGFRNVTFEPVR